MCLLAGSAWVTNIVLVTNSNQVGGRRFQAFALRFGGARRWSGASSFGREPSPERKMMNSSRQQDLALHAEVVDVVTRYATGIDRRDWALFRSAFADDAKVDYGVVGSRTTADDFTAYIRKLPSPAGLSVHRRTNVVITGTSPLTARTHGDALVQHRDDPTTVDHSADYYDDEFISTDDGLKFVSRTTVGVLHERLSGNMAPVNPHLAQAHCFK